MTPFKPYRCERCLDGRHVHEGKGGPCSNRDCECRSTVAAQPTAEESSQMGETENWHEPDCALNLNPVEYGHDCDCRAGALRERLAHQEARIERAETSARLNLTALHTANERIRALDEFYFNANRERSELAASLARTAIERNEAQSALASVTEERDRQALEITKLRGYLDQHRAKGHILDAPARGA
jgi:hypothetical protein